MTAATIRLISIKAAAGEYGLSPWTIRDLIAAQHLKAVHLPGMRRILLDRKDLEKALEAWKL